MRIPLTAAVLLATSLVASGQTGANWSYQGKTGPIVWGKLDPAYRACSSGHEQSPLDIRGARLNKSLQPLQFHYIAGPATLVNTGNGIVLQVNPGSTMTADGVRYNLVELDFHHPSEHAVRGKLSDMEVDLVHRADNGKVAILAVRLNQDRGFANALLASLFDHLPAKPGSSTKITDMVNPGGLLPSDRGYWTYTGSELTPPCTEGVQWYVFEQDLSMSRTQLESFTRLYKLNTRPLQDPHGRKIEADE